MVRTIWHLNNRWDVLWAAECDLATVTFHVSQEKFCHNLCPSHEFLEVGPPPAGHTTSLSLQTPARKVGIHSLMSQCKLSNTSEVVSKFTFSSKILRKVNNSLLQSGKWLGGSLTFKNCTERLNFFMVSCISLGQVFWSKFFISCLWYYDCYFWSKKQRYSEINSNIEKYTTTETVDRETQI